MITITGGVYLVKKVPLKKLYIGNIDGESEATRGDFNQLFYTKIENLKKLCDRKIYNSRSKGKR